MSPKYYMLDKDRNIIETDDVSEWAEWFEDADCLVAYTEVGEYQVSTVFLSLDHNFLDGSGPILFETTVFKGDLVGLYKDRYRTLDEAEAGHAKACKLLEAGELELYSNE